MKIFGTTEKSLSIGERIATDSANIHRFISFENIANHFVNDYKLPFYFAYVDDTAGIFRGSLQEFHVFKSAFDNVDPEQFVWEWNFNDTHFNFLDLTVELDPLRDNVDKAYFRFMTYRKPNYNAQYLHGL